MELLQLQLLEKTPKLEKQLETRGRLYLLILCIFYISDGLVMLTHLCIELN